MVSEDTAKISDRRQTVNNLFVTINALFITGVGYLSYQFFQMKFRRTSAHFFVGGFLSIALITHPAQPHVVSPKRSKPPPH